MAQEGVDVQLVPSPDGQETFLLAQSVDRRSKELAMHEKFIGHMEAGLTKLKAAAESAAGIRTTVRLRHVTEPEAEHKTLLYRLGLTLPRRLKRFDSPAQMW